MVNGKHSENFLNRDATNIHKYINGTTNDNKKIDVNNLNRILREQLEIAINTLNNDSSKSTPNETSLDDITCYKCKRNCRSRGVFCTVGNHWVHSRCQKLSSDEINEVERDSGKYFKCTLCRDQEINVMNHSSSNDQTANLENIMRIPLCNDYLLALTEELDSTRTDEAQESDTDIMDKCTVCDTSF
ncbi:unnamed protein product [Mytilus coruscus]|uniref:PHD-type domain-containing protein n=1 Tax=Mytilus coruscus TaxID=42192 RepID=A0A6J8DB94_MYTCO|nr:unnamed protein product [Mytilus coruscus]